MKKHQIIVISLAIVAAIIGYECLSTPLDDHIDQRLVKAVNAIKTISEESNQSSITIYKSKVDPKELSKDVPDSVVEDLDNLGIRAVYFSYRDDGGYEANFYISRLLESFRSNWYYKYNTDGLFDEHIVPSLEDALKNTDIPYYLCEPAEIENWYFCSSNDP